MAKTIEGKCHICGSVGPLSFEHVPPRAAFNDHGVLEAKIESLIGKAFTADTLTEKAVNNQRGAGKHTLCVSCNNNTGSWFAAAYVAFAKQAMPAAHTNSNDVRRVRGYSIQPLNVLKQILTMFCSACGPNFAEKHPALVRYLLNPESREYPNTRFRIGAALFDVAHSTAARQSGISGRMNSESGKNETFSEISYPPFNFVLSLTGDFPDSRLVDITWMNEFSHRERSYVFLPLLALSVNTYLPAVYSGKK